MGSSQTTVQSADPWEPSQEYIEQGLEAAGDMWNSNPNQFEIQPWDGPAVAQNDPALQQAQNGIISATGGQRANLLGAQGTVTGVRNSAASGHTPQGFRQGNNAGLGASTSPMFNHTMRTVAGARVPGEVHRATRIGMDQSNAAGFDRTIANMTGDGYDDNLRDSLRQNVNEAVMPGMNATFGNSGMTGSSLHQANLAKSLASGMAQTEASFLNRAQDRQIQAAQMGQGALDANRNRALSAGNLQMNAHGQVLDQRMQAAQAQQNADMGVNAMQMQAGNDALGATMGNRDQALSAAGMAPAMSAATYQPLAQQQAVGETRTNAAQTQLAADIMGHQQEQTAPIDAVNNYLGLVSGVGGQFGTSTMTSSSNPGLLGMLGGAGQGLGLLGSLFSDRRLKENIRRVGTMDNGLPVYLYNYIGDARTHMGVMADEVEEIHPEAVVVTPSGFKAVNYGEIAA